MSTPSSSSSSRPAHEFHPTRRLAKFVAPTVWHEFTPLAASTKAVNLGQGFPGWSPPEFVQQAAARAVTEAKPYDFMNNQYARSAGTMPLVTALAKRYSASLGRTVDPLTDVVVADGASEALCCAFLGLCDEGDEVVTLEPAFDIYIAQAEMAGATLKTVPLRVKNDGNGAKWTLDIEELKRAFSPRTRMLLLNTPQNPTGKILTRAELEAIREIVLAYPDVVVVTDEVYEHMCFDVPFTRFASLPDMWERTLSISSAGKTFSVTGWKVGWAVGPAHLVRCLAICHQWLAFSVCTPLQNAIAESLDIADQPYEGYPTYYKWLHAMYLQKRDFMANALREAGIEAIVPEGGFFIVGDTSNVKLPEPYGSDSSVTRDWSLCRWLTKEIGVAAIPPSSFYSPERKNLAGNLARFAVCKPAEVLEEAAKRLLQVKQHVSK